MHRIYILFLSLFFLNGWLTKIQANDTLRLKNNAKIFSKDTILTPANPTFSIKIWLKNTPQDSANQHITTVPFRLLGNLIMVEAEVNQVKGWFILDSGAPDLKLNATHLGRGIPQEHSQAGGITGNVSAVSLQTIAEFRWHHYEMKNIRVESFDLSHIEQVKTIKILGLIGYNLFRDLEILLDYKTSQLILYKLDKSGNKLSVRINDKLPDFTYSFRMSRHVPVIRAKIGEYNLDFGLDTGAELNILDIRLKGKVLANVNIQKRVMLNGNGQDKLEVLAGKLTELTWGELKYKNMRTILTNMESLNKSYNTDLDGVLGYEFLSRRKTAINFLKKEIYIWENPIAPTTEKKTALEVKKE